MTQLFLVAVAAIAFFVGVLAKDPTTENAFLTPTPPATASDKSSTEQVGKTLILKDVGEAYMDNFGLTESDFETIRSAGVDIIEGNFDICASDRDVNFFLNNAQKYGLKVIMPAGSGEAEWGYECDQDNYPKEQRPVWQKAFVVSWVNKWKGNEAIYAWDISNEAGSVLPNASNLNDENSTIPDSYYLSVEQLKSAYSDVKAGDPTRPVMIRMNGWFFYDEVGGAPPDMADFFRAGNPFGSKVADIVMVNAYSNVSDYYPDFVPTVTERSVAAINDIDDSVEVWISLGAWEELPLWRLPDTKNLQKEIDYLKTRMDVGGVAFFKYGARGSEWYLPEIGGGAPQVWEVVKNIR